MPKRYIEDVLPLGELNKYAQKGGGIGSLNAMHPYFARRPLTASRAMTLAALVDAPHTEAERTTLEKLLIGLSSEEWPDKPRLLQRAQELIRQAHGGRAPRVLDPFAGGGSMSLEAMRLGCQATALDLNPVAYLALIASLVYPQRFGRDNKVEETSTQYAIRDTSSASETLPGIEATPQPTTSRLVEDVRYWAEWVMTQAEAQIGDCYPVDPDGAVPVAYLWAKTITCPHCGGEVPMIKHRWLQKGEGSEAVTYQLNVDQAAKTYTVEILQGEAASNSEPSRGTIRGATVECIYCGTPSGRDRIVEQGQAGKIGQHMLVAVLYRVGETGRDFRPATEADRVAYANAVDKLEQVHAQGYDFWDFDRLLSVMPDEPTPHARSRATAIRQYGVTEWSHMFNDRQLLTLIILGQQIRTVRELIAAEDEAYARAVALYLDFVLAKQAIYNAKGAWWQPGGLKTAPVMARHDLPITWDYAEANPFSGQATSWQSFINSLWRSIENAVAVNSEPATVRLGSATELPAQWTGRFDAVITDPPYYDSVNYGDLTDYFYVWHKRVVGDDYPEAFVTEVTPKDDEIIQDVYHGGTKAAAKHFYEDRMAHAFGEIHRVLHEDGIAVVMFAHKKSSAWETLIGALVRAGFQVSASWPLNTEGRRLQSYRAVALASSIYLVCRKRAPLSQSRGGVGGEVQSIGYLEDIESELRTTIRRYLERFWAAGIGGADFFMSAIGPGLSVYSRYPRVERYDGTPVKVSDFLNLVRHEVAAFAIERIVGEQGFNERLDPATQFYLLWRWGYNDWDVPDGEALLLSTAVGIELNLLMERIGLVGKVKGKLRLLGPAARAERLAKVVERVAAGGAVPLVDVLHKACLLWAANQQEELSALVAARGGESCCLATTRSARLWKACWARGWTWRAAPSAGPRRTSHRRGWSS
jgi:putative DNA methylase